jgi:hypothetical protein
VINVFNTEAQPLKAPPPKESYGSTTGLVQSDDSLPFKPIDAPLPAYSQGPTLGSGVFDSAGGLIKGLFGAILRLAGFYL